MCACLHVGLSVMYARADDTLVDADLKFKKRNPGNPEFEIQNPGRFCIWGVHIVYILCFGGVQKVSESPKSPKMTVCWTVVGE